MSGAIDHIILEVNGLRYEALSAGPSDRELVLLLHGFPQFADSWLPVLPALAAAGFHAVAVDQRGYSPAARPPQVEDYDVNLLVSDVLAVADALGAHRFHLVGHDWGGLVAWRLAAHHPQRLLSLTSLATPHWDAFADTLAIDLDQKNKSKYMLLFRAPLHLAETTLLAANAALLRRVYQGKLPPAQVEANVSRLSTGGALTPALNWYRALRPDDRIGQVKVPTLYIWGDQDIALGETAALATRAHVDAPYRFERLPGASHWLLEEHPEQITALLLQHLAAH